MFCRASTELKKQGIQKIHQLRSLAKNLIRDNKGRQRNRMKHNNAQIEPENGDFLVLDEDERDDFVHNLKGE